MKTIETDVAIIGAGPAGATLACLLSSKGVQVHLVDRDLFPRDKVCGEFLSYDALPILESIGVVEKIDESGATRIRSCRIVGSHRDLKFDLPADARGISRRELDHLLLERARDLGTTVSEGWTAEKLDRIHESFSLVLGRGEERVALRARVLCGAWGRWGRFDRILGRPFTRDHDHRYFGFKRHYRRLPDENNSSPSGTIDLFAFASGYLGVNAIEGGETNICGLVHERRIKGNKGGWPSFVEGLRAERDPIDKLYGGHEPTQPDTLSSDPVVFAPRTAVEDGIVLLGDAAGLVDPLAGNGMAMAVQSAALATPLIRSVLSGGITRTEFDRRYRREHARLFEPRIRWSRMVAWLLCRPGLIDALITLLPGRVGVMFLNKTRATVRQVEKLCQAI